MDPDAFIDPDPQIVERLLDAGMGAAKWMTIAPELTGALDPVRTLATRGVVAWIGHTDATYDQTNQAVDAGARAATHVFNALPPLHHREPGALGAVLDRPEISIELICDGVHVSPAALCLVHRVKGGDERVRLITDAMQAAGMPDGDYPLGAAAVTVADGRATLREGGAIARQHADDGRRGAQRRALPRDVGRGAIVLACTNPAHAGGRPLGQAPAAAGSGRTMAGWTLRPSRLRRAGTRSAAG